MGRTNGKLIPFLRNGLMHGLFENLNYDVDKIVFHIELPRYERGRSMDKYEKILREWYRCNGNRYDNYSTAKAVFQANLKKSVHLMSESTSVKKLRFRFANEAEVKENKRLLKEKDRKTCEYSVPLDPSEKLAGSLETAIATSSIDGMFPFFDQFASNPLSVQSSSSGYITSEEAEGRTTPIDLDSLVDLDFILDAKVENDDLDIGNIKVEDLFKPVQQQSLSGSVQEINFTPVDTSQYERKKTYWLCNKKLNLDSILQLICEKQLMEEGNLINEGAVIIPNEVWEPGISYDLQKSFELDGKLFLLWSPRV